MLLRFLYLSLTLEKDLPIPRELDYLMFSRITILAEQVAQQGGD